MPETFPKKEINGIYEIDCKEVDIWEQPLAVVQPFPFLSLPDVLRGRVLEFVLVASEGSTLRLPRGCFPDRVPYSAAASLRTLSFHSRSIKAVCKAVAGDTRLIERRRLPSSDPNARGAYGNYADKIDPAETAEYIPKLQKHLKTLPDGEAMAKKVAGWGVFRDAGRNTYYPRAGAVDRVGQHLRPRPSSLPITRAPDGLGSR